MSDAYDKPGAPSTSPDTEAGGVPPGSLPPYEPTYDKEVVTAQQVAPETETDAP